MQCVGAVCLAGPAQHLPAPPRGLRLSHALVKCTTRVFVPASSPTWAPDQQHFLLLLSPHCSYITRRAKEEFHALAQSTDTAAAEAAWQNAQRQLDVWKRQSVVYGLYGRRVKTVMVSGQHAGAHSRWDNQQSGQDCRGVSSACLGWTYVSCIPTHNLSGWRACHNTHQLLQVDRCSQVAHRLSDCW